MLSDNIREYRKKSNMSQEELAEKLGISRQSISLWETGQTQPTIDNIVALARIFNITSDMLLGNSDSVTPVQDKAPEKKRPIAAIVIAVVAVIAAIILAVVLIGNPSVPSDEPSTPTNPQPTTQQTDPTTDPTVEQFDLFTYCKNFAIEKGTLNGDYCIYQQPATKYGGFKNEYFSISYWADTDRVEFCLHCPLSETYSINFYLIMRGGYDHQYEYSSSKYFRDTGESLRYASGYIDPAVFYDGYPISCSEYIGSVDGQNEFMEESRAGICDLIRCLKKFVEVENMECDFSAFEFKNF